MTNPYGTPPDTSRPAPKWARKRYVLPAIGVALFMGVGIGAAGGDTTGEAKSGATSAVTATATATKTATATETATETETKTADAKPAPTVTVRSTKTVKSTRTVTRPPADGGGGSVYYENCAEARAAGAAPVYSGEPGYGRHLDRDGDGIGCDT